jgi:hypothetical protein
MLAPTARRKRASSGAAINMQALPTRGRQHAPENRPMDWMNKLSDWGAAHVAARDAERAAAREGGAMAQQLRERARTLREHADRLHSEIVRPTLAAERPSNG